jgi:hypothetical protein
VWDVDDEQVQILLATLNRLAGNDVLEKKLALLKKLSENLKSGELAKLLPQTAKQIERLTTMRLPAAPTTADGSVYAIPVVFFVSNEQLAVIEKALALAECQKWSQETAIATREDKECDLKPTKAKRKAAAITQIARFFLERLDKRAQPR